MSRPHTTTAARCYRAAVSPDLLTPGVIVNQTDPTARDRLFALIASIPGSGTVDWCGEARALLDEIAAASAVVSPPTSRAELREAIRRAVCEAEGFAWDSGMLEPDEYGDHADAVLAVLGEQTDQAAVPVCVCGHPEQRHFEDVCQTCGCGDYLEPRDAAEVIARWRQAALDARAELRRLAVEAQQQTDTEAQAFDDRCPACGHTVCDGEGPCGARSGDDFCTCPGPAPAEQQPAAADDEETRRG